MTDIRVLNANELQEAARLADLVFRDQEQKSMGEAFPYIFAAEAPESIGVFEEGRLAAFMGVVPGVITIGPARLHIYSIGSVCTHPDARGQGYASLLLNQAIAHINKAGAALMLVSGDRSLYLRAGCLTFGEAKKYTVQQPSDALHILSSGTSPGTSCLIRPAEPRDYARMASLYGQEEARYDLSLYDLARLVHAEPLASCYKLSHQTWIAQRDNGDDGEDGNDGEAAAFAVIGVPETGQASSRPKVIEAAGEPAAIKSICLEVMSQNGLQELELPVSLHRTELIRELDRSGFPSEAAANEGTVKIMDPARLWRQLLPYLTGRNPQAGRMSAAYAADGSAVQLQLDGKPAAELSAGQFARLVFGQAPDLRLPEEAAALLTECFPIPFPYTGGLYYI
ncbi:GNAT family N-acetyltransferase [Paenibacillus pinistramenti]|uniref:GNAT family N-acetyltransferase n=1 Tax=Paenibacillus pinistramenti TaxID=1768003 RepID=UPI001109C8AD|nr:GNAT family N-acetyltransferase [Paenibacillus pinistramenti]